MINPYRQVEPNDNLALAQMIRQVFIEHDAPKYLVNQYLSANSYICEKMKSYAKNISS